MCDSTARRICSRGPRGRTHAWPPPLGLTALDQARVALAATDLGAADADARARPAAGRSTARDIELAAAPDPELDIAVQSREPGAGGRPRDRRGSAAGRRAGHGRARARCAPGRPAAPRPRLRTELRRPGRVGRRRLRTARRPPGRPRPAQRRARDDEPRRASPSTPSWTNAASSCATRTTRKSRFLASVSHELRSPLNSVVALDPAAQRPGLRPADRRRRPTRSG